MSQMEKSEPDLRHIGRTHLLPETASDTASVTLKDYEIEEPPEHLHASKHI
jgi:hypothetical protein